MTKAAGNLWGLERKCGHNSPFPIIPPPLLRDYSVTGVIFRSGLTVINNHFQQSSFFFLFFFPSLTLFAELFEQFQIAHFISLSFIGASIFPPPRASSYGSETENDFGRVGNALKLPMGLFLGP